MFGTHDRFEYFECSSCGCIQIKEIPSDLSKFYPDNYYSFSQKFSHDSAAKNFLKRNFARLLISNSFFYSFLPPKLKNNFFSWLKKSRINFDSAILDVGCGSGLLLKKMREYGFWNLLGVDKQLKKNLETDGVKILNQDLKEIDGRYDFIMLHHVWEHLDNPDEIMYNLSRLLKDEGRILLRTPCPAYAWKKYKESWVQLDPPRHLFIYTPQALKILAQKHSFKIIKLDYDSTDFQFWASELYQQSIPLYDKNGCQNSPLRFFSPEVMANFRKKAKTLNKKKQGDQAAFWLEKI